eukprot:6784760-Prymnesium_polylepis.1
MKVNKAATKLGIGYFPVPDPAGTVALEHLWPCLLEIPYSTQHASDDVPQAVAAHSNAARASDTRTLTHTPTVHVAGHESHLPLSLPRTHSSRETSFAPPPRIAHTTPLTAADSGTPTQIGHRR